MKGDETMNVQFVKTQMSVWSLGAAVAGLLINAFGLGIVWSNLTNKIEEGEARGNRIENHLTAIDTKLVPFDTAMFRLTTTEATVKANNDAVNDRMDRIVNSLGGKMDALGGKIDLQAVSTGDLRADVKVLTQKVDALSAADKRAEIGATPPALASR